MTGLTIGYEFIFNVAVKKRNGMTFKKSTVTGLGGTYDSAVWDIYNKLKKKRSEILKINSVRGWRIAFTFENGKLIPTSLAEYPPKIPEDLNQTLKYLPKKAKL